MKINEISICEEKERKEIDMLLDKKLQLKMKDTFQDIYIYIYIYIYIMQERKIT